MQSDSIAVSVLLKDFVHNFNLKKEDAFNLQLDILTINQLYDVMHEST